jgi:hypothetical protein
MNKAAALILATIVILGVGLVKLLDPHVAQSRGGAVAPVNFENATQYANVPRFGKRAFFEDEDGALFIADQKYSHPDLNGTIGFYTSSLSTFTGATGVSMTTMLVHTETRRFGISKKEIYRVFVSDCEDGSGIHFVTDGGTFEIDDVTEIFIWHREHPGSSLWGDVVSRVCEIAIEGP